MATYYAALPIYRAAMDVAVRVDAAVQRFPKGHKHTLGARLRDTTTNVVLLVARANRRDTRADTLVALCDRVDELNFLVNFGQGGQSIS